MRPFEPVLLALALLTLVPNASHAAARNAEISGVINLNTATEAELRRLPSIGPAKAERILAQRAKHKFDTIDQLMKVKGIGRKTYRLLKPHLAVNGPTTLQKVAKNRPAPDDDERATEAKPEASTRPPTPKTPVKPQASVMPAAPPIPEALAAR
jgi:competence protein ComEA